MVEIDELEEEIGVSKVGRRNGKGESELNEERLGEES